MWTRLRKTWRALLRRKAWERDMEDELALHVECRAAELVNAGMEPAEAQRRARLELGSREAWKEECRRSFGLRGLDELRQDARYAVRVLLRKPGLAAVAVISLALGIGANTVVFGVLNTILLKPLPVAAPDQLRFVETRIINHSYPNYRDLRDRNTTLSYLAAYRIAPMGVEIAGSPRRAWGYLATGNYFPALGIQPALGRFFGPADDQPDQPVAVISYDCWQSRFGGDLEVTSRPVRINGLPYTVVGVAPRGFTGTELFFQPEVWVPLAMQRQIEGHDWRGERGNSGLWVFGRLRPGVTARRAEAELNAIAADLARAWPDSSDGMTIQLTPLGMYGSRIRGAVESFLLALLALAGLVLLATCANLASQLTARAADRHFEMAVRLAIGGSRGRILRQLLTESLLLALLGGAAGALLAAVLLRALTHWRPALHLPISFDVTPDPLVFLFAFLACLAAGLFFGIAPARQSLKADPNRALRGMASGRSAGARVSIRDLVLALQVAVCCLLLTASFVSIQGLARAVRMPLGFRPEQAYATSFDLTLAAYSPPEARDFQGRALDAVSALPGVAAAGFGNALPLGLNQSRTVVFAPETRDFRLSNGVRTFYYAVSPGYFAALGMPLLAGRDFTGFDHAGAPEVAVVNETLARQLTGGPDAVGRRFRYTSGGEITIVGVVADAKYETLTEPPRAALFRPAMQPFDAETLLLVRSVLPETAVVSAVRRTLTALDPRLPLIGPAPVADLQNFAFFPARAATVALGAFGVLALMLALTGVYGLASYSVSRRVREIGIRVALGARPADVVRSVLGRTAILLAAGSGFGLLLGSASARLLATVVVQATPRDPLIIGSVVATMLLAGLAATWLPARRAMSVDPIRSLRHD